MLSTLQDYKEVFGDALVPLSFVVPSGDLRWPQEVWGYRLGKAVTRLRFKLQKGEVSTWTAAELHKLEFVEDVQQYYWNEIVLPSLKVFRQEHGHCMIKQAFVIPARPPWPEKAWRKLLGVMPATSVAGALFVKQVAILEQLDFAWDHNLWIWNERIFPAMEVYVAQFGHCRVPNTYIVPDRHPWPKSVWGMKLGRRLYTLKDTGAYFAIMGRDIERLKRLGFSFELREHGWKKRVVPLLETYEAILGDKQVPHDFAIPSEAPWPKKMWGVALGLIVARNAHHLVNA